MAFLIKYKTIFAVLFAWFAIHLCYVCVDGLYDTGASADVAVILGNKVNEDGTLSERLEQRLACGLQLYRDGRVKRLIVSGGLGKEGFYEGDEMKAYLLSHQVPDSVVLVDNYGDNTLATVLNTLSLKDSIQFKSVIAVSNYYHLTRAKMLFRKKGFENVEGVSPKFFEWRDVYSLFREFIAFYVELF